MVLNRFQMAAVKRTAQNTKKLVSKRGKIESQIRALTGEIVDLNNQIESWETPIKAMTGGHTSDQVIAWNGVIPESVEATEVIAEPVVAERVSAEVINDVL